MELTTCPECHAPAEIVGRETAVFHRSSSAAGGLEHLSLSLKLMGSLPAPPAG